MNPRLLYRLLAALMLLPAAWGAGGIAATPRTAQAIVRPYQRQRRAPQPVEERVQAPIPQLTIQPSIARHDPQLPALLIYHSLFQRPPPASLRAA
jgi:hypothetical protein